MARPSNRDDHFWMGHLAKFQASGLTLREYCRRENIQVHQFYYWRKRATATKLDPKTAGTGFQPDTKSSSNTSQLDGKSVVIQMNDGTLVHVPVQFPDTIEAVIKIAQRIAGQAYSTQSVSSFRSVIVR